jgi:hypothetical protein
MSFLCSSRIAFEALRSLAFGGIGANYAAVGTAAPNPIRIIKISNDTDADLLVSFNGVADHDFVAAGSFVLYDYGSNKADPAGYLEQPAQTTVYVKEAAGAATVGSVYITMVYVSHR